MSAIPDGWTDVRGVYTISMPSFVLEEGELAADGGVIALVYDPPLGLHPQAACRAPVHPARMPKVGTTTGPAAVTPPR